MKSLTALEIVVIVIVLILTLWFVLGWLGIVPSPLDWMKKTSLQTRFCSEIQNKLNCQIVIVPWSDVYRDINENTPSSTIKCKEIGNIGNCRYASGDTPATYGDICDYLRNKRVLRECLEKLCNCKFS
jgi:hypothetical protein